MKIRSIQHTAFCSKFVRTRLLNPLTQADPPPAIQDMQADRSCQCIDSKVRPRKLFDEIAEPERPGLWRVACKRLFQHKEMVKKGDCRQRGVSPEKRIAPVYNARQKCEQQHRYLIPLMHPGGEQEYRLHKPEPQQPDAFFGRGQVEVSQQKQRGGCGTGGKSADSKRPNQSGCNAGIVQPFRTVKVECVERCPWILCKSAEVNAKRQIPT